MIIFISFNATPLAVDLITTFLLAILLKSRLFPFPLIVMFSFVILKSSVSFISLVIFTIEFATSIAFFNSSNVSTFTSCFLYFVVVVVIVTFGSWGEVELVLLLYISRYWLSVSFIVLSDSLLLLIFRISSLSFLCVFFPFNVILDPFFTLIPQVLWFSLFMFSVTTIELSISIPTSFYKLRHFPTYFFL